MFRERNSVFIILAMIILITVIALYGLKGYNSLISLVEIPLKRLELLRNLVHAELWDCLFRLMHSPTVAVVCTVIHLKESRRICLDKTMCYIRVFNRINCHSKFYTRCCWGKLNYSSSTVVGMSLCNLDPFPAGRRWIYPSNVMKKYLLNFDKCT